MSVVFVGVLHGSRHLKEEMTWATDKQLMAIGIQASGSELRLEKDRINAHLFKKHDYHTFHLKLSLIVSTSKSFHHLSAYKYILPPMYK